MVKINEIIVSGFVPRDPFTNTSNGEKSFMSFTVGVDKSYMNSKKEWVNQTAWVPVKLWATDNRISKIAEKVTKGCHVLVNGQIDQSSYKDKNGNTVFEVFIRASSIQIVEAAKENNSNTSGNNSQSSGSTQNNQGVPDDMTSNPGAYGDTSGYDFSFLQDGQYDQY